MKKIIYVLQFRGRASSEGDILTASSCTFTTKLGPDGVNGSFAESDDDIATFESRVTRTGERSFVESGTICFGKSCHKLRFSTLGQGYLERSVQPELKHGSVIFRVDGGEGEFANATGMITSNFTESGTGAVVDNQLAVI